jgi:hypothetical protein
VTVRNVPCTNTNLCTSAWHTITVVQCGVVLLIVALFNGWPQASYAADIKASNDAICAFRLEGAIVLGDHDRLANLIARSRLDPLNERTSALCLESLGGSYSEGLKIAELVYSRGISTVVVDGGVCLSACSIIFMAGVLPNREVPHRKLSAGAVLGFHAPYLSMPNEKYSKEQVEAAAQSMRVAILGLVRLSSKQTTLAGGDFIKKSLIAGVLEKGPDEASFVKTVATAARWDILIYDAVRQFPKAGNVEGMKNLCNNFHYANMDEPVPRVTNLSLKVDQYASKFHKEAFRILVRDGKTNDTVCEVYPRTMRGSDDVSFHACSYDYWSSKSFGDCREYKTAALFGKYVPQFFTLDPGTTLKRFH